jgi:hypothetical protein
MIPLARKILNRLVRSYQFVWSSVIGHLWLARFFRRPFFKKAVKDIRNTKSILIIKADEIGDVILATGLLKSIRRQFWATGRVSDSPKKSSS